jgi:hypothetical protein
MRARKAYEYAASRSKVMRQWSCLSRAEQATAYSNTIRIKHPSQSFPFDLSIQFSFPEMRTSISDYTT